VLHRNLKSFLRILGRLYRSRSSNIVVYTTNDILIEMLDSIFNRYPVPTTIAKSLVNIKEISYRKKRMQLVILLDAEFLTLTHKFAENNVFLIQKVNTVYERQQFGAYKIFNNLTDIKKILFFFLLIKVVLKRPGRMLDSEACLIYE